MSTFLATIQLIKNPVFNKVPPKAVTIWSVA